MDGDRVVLCSQWQNDKHYYYFVCWYSIVRSFTYAPRIIRRDTHSHTHPLWASALTTPSLVKSGNIRDDHYYYYYFNICIYEQNLLSGNACEPMKWHLRSTHPHTHTHSLRSKNISHVSIVCGWCECDGAFDVSGKFRLLAVRQMCLKERRKKKIQSIRADDRIDAFELSAKHISNSWTK